MVYSSNIVCCFWFSFGPLLFFIHTVCPSTPLITSCSRWNYGNGDERQSCQRPFWCQRQKFQLPHQSVQRFPKNCAYFQDDCFSSFILGRKVSGVRWQPWNVYVAPPEAWLVLMLAIAACNPAPLHWIVVKRYPTLLCSFGHNQKNVEHKQICHVNNLGINHK